MIISKIIMLIMIKQFVKILEIGRLYKCSFFNNTITLLGLENSEDLRRFKESFEAKRGPYDDDASGFGHRIMTAMDQNFDRTDRIGCCLS